jgi:hypothetical protein
MAMVVRDPLAFWISWNTTASQADLAGQPPSSFLFLPSKDEPARRRVGLKSCETFWGSRSAKRRRWERFGLVAQLVRARA